MSRGGNHREQWRGKNFTSVQITLHGERSERQKGRPMNAIALTVASTSMARARDRGYRDHRRARINLKFNPARIAGEQGMRRLMRRARRSSAQFRLPHPGGDVGEEQSATKP
jgi:hypothetical protein